MRVSITFLFIVSIVFLSCDQGVVIREIRLDPASLETVRACDVDLGSLDGTEESRTAKVTISNSGAVPIDIERVEYSNPGAFTVHAADLLGPLQAGRSADLDLRFHPTAPGIYSSTVTVHFAEVDTFVEITVQGEKLDR